LPNAFKEAGLIKQDQDKDVARFIIDATARGGSLRDAQLMDILEFGRMIHAEMSAICDAARQGRVLKHSILYCTTFPCHICAKHIVASGIAKVVFVEPFPKSYAEQLHGDAIVIGRSTDSTKVSFEPFIGISPFRYRDLFARERRKNDIGDFEQWADGEARPIIKYTVQNWIVNEAAAAKALTEVLKSKAEEGALQLVSSLEV